MNQTVLNSSNLDISKIANKAEAVQTWVVSLHRWYAEEILTRSKLFEYRRVRMSCKIGDRVLVYATHPDKVILGEFTVGENSLYGVTPEIAINAAPRDERESLEEYFYEPTAAKSVTALEVANPIIYVAPESLQDMCDIQRAPQSYCKAKVISEPKLMTL